MSTRKEVLVTQLRACHNQDGWFAPLKVALRGVTAEQAVQGGKGSSNSIYGIVHHLVFWNERYLQRFHEGNLPPLEISNSETFQSNEMSASWDELQMKLDNVLAQWEQAIMNYDDSKLDSPTHPDRDEVWWMSLAHLAIHNAYHIGQIVHIRKEQGSWEAWEQ
ncbi:DinB family protein [Brevibacillus massiliensis]|uniref:DinB family protein n=1 Tax=Brevibacillus massiliensis TaxID=1118054 RepID=UPI000316647E|nr:DinB family protein [Brevibacillus massiliensis]